MPVIADVYCSAGGTSKGYSDAGFDVVGCDINPQPNYPYTFYQMDAIEFIQKYGKDFDAIGASPPCQKYSKSTKQWRKAGVEYPDLVEITRNEIQKLNIPYIIENVPGSPLINPIFLNGYMFGLLVHRPRLFECNFTVIQPPLQKTKPVKMGRPVKEGQIIQPVGHFSGVEYAKKQMQIDWMTQKELTQAIPPVYTKYIGGFLMEKLFVVRLYDGFDNVWINISDPVNEFEAKRIWNEKTKNGTQNTTFQDIDYYRIFPADTTMLFSA